ncbi:glycoside hydrolase domain-containing protein [Mesorhizobium sp. M0203]|uniref:glycoside hydrolase domain-containing protein n=1 Tax=Mesorhizobium sp. M0203 TaxID=2956912 RepID=UPI003337CF9C
MSTRRQFVCGSSLALASALPIGRADAATPPDTSAVNCDEKKPTLGIDIYSYFQDANERAIRKNNFQLTCLYLTHSITKIDHEWISKKDYLAERDWGFLPTYIGNQSDSPAEADGTLHGEAAIKLMKQAQFPRGSVVYFDIETPKPAGGKYEAYLRAWMKAVLKGAYYPGVYGSYLMVPWLTKITSAIWTVELPGNTRATLESAALQFNRNVMRKSDQTGEQALSDVGSNSEFYDFLFEQGILAYNPKQFPQGIIRQGCIATQYLWKQKNLPGLPPKMSFDFDRSLVADPSNAPSIAVALGVQDLIRI